VYEYCAAEDLSIGKIPKLKVSGIQVFAYLILTTHPSFNMSQITPSIGRKKARKKKKKEAQASTRASGCVSRRPLQREPRPDVVVLH
jgi:hypothetical protein